MTTASPGAAAGADRPLLGVLLMVAFCMLAPLGDAIAKLLGALPLGQICSSATGCRRCSSCRWSRLGGRRLRLGAAALAAHRAPHVLHILSLGAFFAALRFLPMADAVAIAFVHAVHPAPPRPPPPRRGGRPAPARRLRRRLCRHAPRGPAELRRRRRPALLPLAVALLFALFMLVTRQIARDADPVVLQAASGLVATLFLAPLVLLAEGRGWPELDPVAISGADWRLLLLLGVLGTAAHLLMTWSLRFAPSATLAPMQYLEIPFATLIGYLVFGALPNGLAAVGIAITICRRPLRPLPRAHRQPRRPAGGLTLGAVRLDHRRPSAGSSQPCRLPRSALLSTLSGRFPSPLGARGKGEWGDARNGAQGPRALRAWGERLRSAKALRPFFRKAGTENGNPAPDKPPASRTSGPRFSPFRASRAVRSRSALSLMKPAASFWS